MGRINKRSILITIFLCLILLYGCDKVRFYTYKGSDEKIGKEDIIEENVEDDETKVPEVSEDNPDNSTTNLVEDNGEKTAEEITPTLNNIQPIANTELMIYTVNVDSAEIEAVTAVVQEDLEISPELIVTKVTESMADQSLNLGVESVTIENDNIVISFYSDQPPLSGVGGGLEEAILNAIAQSLMDNLTDYRGVIFRTEGKAYVSGHIELGIDEVYLGAE